MGSPLGLMLTIDADPSRAEATLGKMKGSVNEFAVGAAADFEQFGKSGVFAFEDVQHKLIESTREMAKLRAEILATNDAAEKLRLTEKLKEAQSQFTATRTEMRGLRLETIEASEKANLFAAQFGLHIPAEMGRLIARIPGVQSALSKLFEVGIIFAFTRALAEAITHWDKFADAINEAIGPISEAEVKILNFFGLLQEYSEESRLAAIESSAYSEKAGDLAVELLKKRFEINEEGLKGSRLAITQAKDKQAVDKVEIAGLDAQIGKYKELVEKKGDEKDATKLGQLEAEKAHKQRMAALDEEEGKVKTAIALTEEREKAEKKAEEAAKQAAAEAKRAEHEREENLKREEEQGLRASKEIQDLTLKLEGADTAMIQYYNRLLEIQDAYGETALAANIAKLATEEYLAEEHAKTEKLEEEANKAIQGKGEKAEKPEVVQQHLELMNRTLAELKGHVATIHALYGPVSIQQEIMNPEIIRNAQAWDEQFNSVRRLAGSDVFNQLIKKFGAVKVASAELQTDAIGGWEKMADAIGGAAAHALVYGGNFGKAMREAAKASLESLASQALSKALFETGEGFALLAIQDYPDAALAFQSAAIFGAIGAAEAGLGRAIPGGGRSGASGGGGYGGGRGGGGAGGVGGTGGSVPVWATASGSASAVGAFPGGTVIIHASIRESAQYIGKLVMIHAQNGGLLPQNAHPAPVTPGITHGM